MLPALNCKSKILKGRNFLVLATWLVQSDLDVLKYQLPHFVCSPHRVSQQRFSGVLPTSK